MTFFTFLSALVALVVTILWLVIGWRAMRAHENIADSAAILANQARKIADSNESQAVDLMVSRKSVDLSKLPKIRDDQK